MKARKHLRALLAAALTAAVSIHLAGCGGGGGSGDSSPPPPSGSGTAVLEWDPVVAADLSGYRVHYGTASGSYQQTVNAGSSTAYTLNGLSSGTRYYFAVTALDSSGQESGYSNEVFKDIP
jgi:hypothetical protein